MKAITLEPISRIEGEINLPGSKSLSNRALLLAALAKGTTTVTNLLDSDDIRHMLNALKALGVNYQLSEDKTCCEVEGLGGAFQVENGLSLFLGNAGTAMRPLTAALCLKGNTEGEVILTGEPRMKERPIKHLVDALLQAGANVRYLENDGYPPVAIRNQGIKGGVVKIDGSISSQFLTALLMAAPAGAKSTMGLDPGLRTGVKVAVVDNTGKLLDTTTIYPHTGREAEAQVAIFSLIRKHNVELIAIGNGTASRETERFAKEVIKEIKENKPQTVVVSEAGASVYSASEFAANEFPNLDVSLRGAVSIARRLQDPLAELVKIEPKAIGVGQYQHDVNQTQLARKLDAVVEDCVNAVGVDLNTASAPLLARVAGMTKTLAQNIVEYRDENGRFESRAELKKVPRLGPKAFEQCAGFMRIAGGKNPLDASGVHPEAYPVVEKILQATAQSIQDLMGNAGVVRQLDAKQFIDEQFGLPTVQDIFKELEKPGRDPRGEFKTAVFAEGVEEITDLKPGMILEGTVTNVTNFGAFVDIGVHQDGLVHISSLSDKFVEDPHQVVKTGDIVKVKVLEVDVPRKRIALTMRLDESAVKNDGKSDRTLSAKPRSNAPRQDRNPRGNSAMGNAFADALKNWKK